jgi:excinuclease ABC subunit B
MTNSMQRAMGETARRREIQLAYNLEHGITPTTVISAIRNSIEDEIAAHETVAEAAGIKKEDYVTAEYLEELQAEMLKAAQELDFERAAELRDKIAKLKGEPVASPQKKKGRKKR